MARAADGGEVLRGDRAPFSPSQRPSGSARSLGYRPANLSPRDHGTGAAAHDPGWMTLYALLMMRQRLPRVTGIRTCDEF